MNHAEELDDLAKEGRVYISYCFDETFDRSPAFHFNSLSQEQ